MRIYDYYGSRESDIKGLSDLISEATGLTFQPHDSDYSGEYYLAPGSSREELKLMSNELEDEEGKFLMWPEFGEFKTILSVKVVLESATEPLTFLDGLLPKLGNVAGLIYLERKRPSPGNP